MSGFVDRAAEKLDKLSDEQIRAVLDSQKSALRIRDGLLDSVDSGILVLDNDLKVVYVNNFLGDVFNFNYKKAQKADVHVSKIIRDEGVLSFIFSNCKDPKSEPYDFDYSSNMFGQMRVRLNAYKMKNRVPDSTGKAGERIVFFRFVDITLFEKMKYEFKKNESLAQMTTVAATVAHEIKNPLASISIYLQLLKKKLDKDGAITKEGAEKSITVISNEIERLNNIVVDFLFAVKPMNVNLKLDDINICVKNVAELSQAEIKENNIVLKLNPGSALPKLNIDGRLIEQCLLNLVRNAIQAMNPDSSDNMITINTFQDGNTVKLTVSDTGSGISSDIMDKIFEPYFTTKASGSGLGLTTIFKIMKRHDGEVTVSSEVGKGTTFMLVFPIPQSERLKIAQ